jgi:hypothetical protein
MNHYGSMVARISALDSLIGKLDPGWQPMAPTAATSLASGSFAGILEGISGQTSSTDPVATTAVTNPYANTIYSDIHVLASSRALDPRIEFSSPMPGARLTQEFGPSTLAMEPPATVNGHHYAHYHSGIDLARKLGTPILAAADGVVIEAGREPDGAVVVRIRHDDGYVSLYGHLNPDLDVKKGERVTGGQQVGLEGMTGRTTGPHLHFALFNKSGKAVDPTPYLDSGALPDAGSLATPTSTSDRGSTAYLPAATVLARFDKVASTIPYANQIRAAAVNAGIDPLLLAALVSNESNFHPSSISSAGAIGLTQLMPATARGMRVNPYDIQGNLDGGAKYLALQLRRFSRVDVALAAYNKGPGTVYAVHSTVPPSANRYISRVLAKWAHYEDAAT